MELFVNIHVRVLNNLKDFIGEQTKLFISLNGIDGNV